MRLEIINEQDIPKKKGKYEEIVKKVAALKRGETLKVTDIEANQIPSIKNALRSRLLLVRAKTVRTNNGYSELYLLKEE